MQKCGWTQTVQKKVQVILLPLFSLQMLWKCGHYPQYTEYTVKNGLFNWVLLKIINAFST